MKAFISYRHFDDNHLKQLHKHLAQLERDKSLNAWTDNEILAGSKIDEEVAAALHDSDLLIAGKNYCKKIDQQIEFF